MAHVSGGHEDSKPWEQHLAFLSALGRVLLQEADDPRTNGLPVVVADINQRDQPRPYGNAKVRKAWGVGSRRGGSHAGHR